jgi:hypothetical protein
MNWKVLGFCRRVMPPLQRVPVGAPLMPFRGRRGGRRRRAPDGGGRETGLLPGRPEADRGRPHPTPRWLPIRAPVNLMHCPSSGHPDAGLSERRGIARSAATAVHLRGRRQTAHGWSRTRARRYARLHGEPGHVGPDKSDLARTGPFPARVPGESSSIRHQRGSVLNDLTASMALPAPCWRICQRPPVM